MEKPPPVTSFIKVIYTETKQDRQSTYNPTLRRIYETTFAVEKQLLHISLCACARARASVCMCVHAYVWACACARLALLINPATRSHIAICSLSGSTTFFDIIS